MTKAELVRFNGRWPVVQKAAVAGEQVFEKIPGGQYVAGIFFTHCLEQRVRIPSDDVLFFGHRERDLETAGAELLDGLVIARFLATEVVAGNTYDHQAGGSVFFPQGL